MVSPFLSFCWRIENTKTSDYEVFEFLITAYFLTGEPQLTVILCLAPEPYDDHLNDLPHHVQKLVDPYELSPFITEVGCFFFHLTTIFVKAFCTFRISVKDVLLTD